MPAELQSSRVVAFSHRNRSHPAPRAVRPGNCEALRSDSGGTSATVCGAAFWADTKFGNAAAPAVAATDFTKPRRDSLFSSATIHSQIISRADKRRHENTKATKFFLGKRSVFVFFVTSWQSSAHSSTVRSVGGSDHRTGFL